MFTYATSVKLQLALSGLPAPVVPRECTELGKKKKKSLCAACRQLHFLGMNHRMFEITRDTSNDFEYKVTAF